MKIFILIFLSSAVFLIQHVNGGGFTFNDLQPRTNMFIHKQVRDKVSNCFNSPQEVRDAVQNATRELRRITHNYDEAVNASGGIPEIDVIEQFVVLYTEVEEELLLEIPEYYNLDYLKFMEIIHNFGAGATGDYACAYELFGEGVGDTMDFYEYSVKNLRHDIVGYPHDADKECTEIDEVEDAVEEAKASIYQAYKQVQLQTQNSNYDHFIVAYNFIEGFEKAMWKLSDYLEAYYGLGHELWKNVLVHNGKYAHDDYLCAYGAYYRAENAYVETYLRLIMDIVQKEKQHSFLLEAQG